MRQVAWHTVPERVLTVRLNGSVDYEASDGEVRHVPHGSFVLILLQNDFAPTRTQF